MGFLLACVLSEFQDQDLCSVYSTEETKQLTQVQKSKITIIPKTFAFVHVSLHFQHSHQEILCVDSAAGRGADEAYLPDRKRVQKGAR